MDYAWNLYETILVKPSFIAEFTLLGGFVVFESAVLELFWISAIEFLKHELKNELWVKLLQ